MTDNCLNRIKGLFRTICAQNEDLKIVTFLDAQEAYISASSHDRRRQNCDDIGPLEGLLLGVKENISVSGLQWSAGLGAWKDRIAAVDSLAVGSLRAAGAIPTVMLNMHEGAFGATTNNPHFGRTANPLDPKRTPGGSSGGSAAAIAAGFTDIALGTDTMGSIRVPAAYCGVTGLKPTRGLIPRTGLQLLSSTLDTIGPIAREVALLGPMTEIMAQFSSSDPFSRSAPLNWSAEPSDTLPLGLTVGIPTQINTVDCEEVVFEGLSLARKTLESCGVRVIDVDVVGWKPSLARRSGLLIAEAEGAVSLKAIFERSGSDLMSQDLRALLSYGRDLSSERLVNAYARTQLAALAAHHAFAKVDVLLMPTAPQRAFLHKEKVPVNQADFTSLANFHGGPALALPIPHDFLPNSVQLIGQEFSEALLLTIGKLLETQLSK